MQSVRMGKSARDGVDTMTVDLSTSDESDSATPLDGERTSACRSLFQNGALLDGSWSSETRL